MTVGLVICVTDWLPDVVPPGTYSPTVPETVTASPTATVGRGAGEDEDALAGGRVVVGLRVLDPEAARGAVGRARR